jgi:oxygen-dependent protoporphyrinogen oxidase
MNRTRIAVVGGGIAGLTAAWCLRQRGFEVLVLEANAQPGGRARSTSTEGIIHDLGAWSFTGNGPVMRLANELHLNAELTVLPFTVGRFVSGKLRVARLSAPLSFLGTVFTFGEALEGAKLIWMARRSWSDETDETAARWAERHFSDGFRRNVLEPAAALFYLQDLDTLSRNAFLGTMRYLSTTTLHSFHRGMGVLPSALAEQIEVRCGAKVESVECRRNSVHLYSKDFSEKVDGVIFAVPLPELGMLLDAYFSPAAREAISQWKYSSTLVIRCLIRGRWSEIALSVLPPRGSGWLASSLTVERAKSPMRVPEGHELVTMYAQSEQVATLAAKSDGELARLFSEELERWTNTGKRDVEKCWVERWQHAAANTDPQLPKRLSDVRDGFEALASSVPVWAAGDFLGVSGLPGAVESGERAAEACSRHFHTVSNAGNRIENPSL